MGEWTERMAAQNWCDQYKKNGGNIAAADMSHMDNACLSFYWFNTTQGLAVWKRRYEYLSGDISTRLCR